MAGAPLLSVQTLRGLLIIFGLMLATSASVQAQTSPSPRGAVLREMPPWSMFLSADVVVKVVMVGLAFASLATWTVFLAKSTEITVLRRRLRAALERTAEAATLDEARALCAGGRHALARLLEAAAHP